MSSLATINGECWEWTGPTRKDGYGILWNPDTKRMDTVHRYIATKLHDTVSVVCHTCNNTRCIRPAHLFPGDSTRNQCDARDAGHLAFAKINMAIADEIRSRYIRGMARELGEEYGISKRAVNDIISGRTWNAVERA